MPAAVAHCPGAPGAGRVTGVSIEVEQTGSADPLEFLVVVREGNGETRHRVTMARGVCEQLGQGRYPPAVFIEAAFRFLLDREPKESILGRFDVTVISRYFPEFETALPGYLDQLSST